ncbi:hypothetical protein ACFE04_012292 [Oxalis oulophora]
MTTPCLSAPFLFFWRNLAPNSNFISHVWRLSVITCKLVPISKPNLSSLKTLVLCKVEIPDHLPQSLSENIENLCLLNCHGFNSLHFSYPAKRCKNLRSMTLFYTDIAAKWLNEGLSYHLTLKVLRIFDCEMMQVVKISSASLASLEISSCRNLTAIKLHAPSLDFSANASCLHVRDHSLFS